jgi:hypothetical protein
MKTILLRFCPDALKKPKLHHGMLARLKRLGHPRYMGERVAHANNLGELLTRTEPRRHPSDSRSSRTPRHRRRHDR